MKFFLNVGEGAPKVTSSLLSATFPTLWLKPLATQLVYNLIFLNNFLLGYTKNALQSTWIQQTLHEQQPAYQGKC